MDITTLTLILQGAAALVTIALFVFNVVLSIKSRKKKEVDQEEAEHESVRSLLRSEIVRIYYANRERKALHSFEYENVVKLYGAYKKMGGNSFVDKIWEEIRAWKILP